MYSSYIFINKEVIMPVAMDAVQMNTRIDRTLKREGDAALAAAGFTPSQAVRALWENAVRMRREPESLRDFLTGKEPLPQTQHTADTAQKEIEADDDEGLRAHKAHVQAIQQRFESIGIDTSTPYADDEDDRDALSEILMEKYWEERQ